MNKCRITYPNNKEVREYKSRTTKEGAGAATVPCKTASGNYTGESNVYFNIKYAFSSAKRLFCTMGHEFVHVSQFSLLMGQSSTILTDDFLNMIEYHAYSYQASIGGSNFNDFDINDIMRWSKAYPEYNSMLYYNLPWTQNVSFKYPF